MNTGIYRSEENPNGICRHILLKRGLPIGLISTEETGEERIRVYTVGNEIPFEYVDVFGRSTVEEDALNKEKVH